MDAWLERPSVKPDEGFARRLRRRAELPGSEKN